MSAPIRVALSGSGFKFPAHVGALHAIHDAGYEVIEIAGTSGGSIVASLLACGMTLADMKNLSMTHDWSEMLGFNLFAIPKMGYCTGNSLLDWLVESTGGKIFAKLQMSLTVVSSDIATNRPFVFNSRFTPLATVALAARSSASIPFVYEPVRYKDALLMDGGMVNNIPVDRLIVDSVPRIGVQLVSNYQPLKPGGSISATTISLRLIDLMLSSQESAHVSTAVASGAIMAYVETGYASCLDRNMEPSIRQRLFDDGYAAAKAALVSK